MQYSKYNIKETDTFNAYDFPKVQGEIDDIIKASRKVKSGIKGEIILSYLKDHSLKKEWMDESPELTTLLTDNHFTTAHIEALFESCRQNKPFLKGFEDYVVHELN